MLVRWLVDLGVLVFDWFSDRLGSLPTFRWPGPYTLRVPMPFLAGTQLAAFQTWATVTLAIAVVLGIGRLCLFVYRLIPFNS